MPDRIQYLKYFERPQETITPSQFHNWGQSHITQALRRDLISYLFEELDKSPPSTIEETALIAHQREGMGQVIDAVINWVPQSVAEARAKAASQGKKVEEDDEN